MVLAVVTKAQEFGLTDNLQLLRFSCTFQVALATRDGGRRGEAASW